MKITLQHRLEEFFFTIPYAYTFRYIQSLKTKQIRFQDFFYNLDHILCSNICCEWVFYIRHFSNNHINSIFSLFQFSMFLFSALFNLPIFPPQATSKISEVFYTDLVCAINLGTITACYDIKYIKEFLYSDEQYQQLAKQQLA